MLRRQWRRQCVIKTGEVGKSPILDLTINTHSLWPAFTEHLTCARSYAKCLCVLTCLSTNSLGDGWECQPLLQIRKQRPLREATCSKWKSYRRAKGKGKSSSLEPLSIAVLGNSISMTGAHRFFYSETRSYFSRCQMLVWVLAGA